MKELIKIFLVLCGVIIWIALITISILHAVDRTEVGQCYKWKKQSGQFVGYYITEWQKMQCDYHGITIDAPVR